MLVQTWPIEHVTAALSGPPPQKLRPMPEPVAGVVVILHLSNQDRLEWVPLADSIAELCHHLAWYSASESGRLDDIADI